MTTMKMTLITVDPVDIMMKMYPRLMAPEVGDNIEVKNVISILTTIIVPDHPTCPSSIFSHEDRPTVQAEVPSNVSPAVRDEDPSDVSADVREDPSTATDLPPHLCAVPTQYDPRVSDVSTDVREDPSTATDLPPHPCAVPIQYDPRATGLTA